MNKLLLHIFPLTKVWWLQYHLQYRKICVNTWKCPHPLEKRLTAMTILPLVNHFCSATTSLILIIPLFKLPTTITLKFKSVLWLSLNPNQGGLLEGSIFGGANLTLSPFHVSRRTNPISILK